VSSATTLICLDGTGPGGQAFSSWSAALAPAVDVAVLSHPSNRDVAALARSIVEHARGRPYAVYGHRTGAWTGLAAVRELARRAMRLPVRLFVSGIRPPDPPRDTAEPAVDVPLRAFAGCQDRAVDPAELVGWSRHTTNAFVLSTEPGDLDPALATLAAPIRTDLESVRTGGQPRTPPLGDDGVHLWYADLRRMPALAEATGELSAGEAARAARLRHDVDRRCHVACRVLLRRILAEYGVEPGRTEFATGPHGKPYLPAAGLCFNLSRSSGLALVAVAADSQEVGVDIERHAPIRDLARFCAGVLHPEERATHEALPRSERLRHALTVWTAKEAVLKASGDGLSIEPRLLCFEPWPPAAAGWVATVPDDVARLAGWRVTQLRLPEAIGAVARRHERWRLRFVRLP
jgi:4'-phosphopantetheinyl transferase